MRSLLPLLGLLLGASPIALFMGLFAWLRRSARSHLPRQEGDSLVFFLAPPARILLTSVLVALVLFTALVFVASRSEGGSFIAVLIPLSLLLVMLFAKPREVTLTRDGVHQPHWLKQDREIAWNEVESIRRGLNTGTTYVRSRNGGRAISFSPLLVGQSRFEKEVKAHARHCDEIDIE
jgi:hypothetical protein